ncbi:MAG TPA: alpha/beta hydrolase [Spirochaetota bacterium]|nr:alpha/beta hydrolase [Spirochaetota bacterium]HOD15825.1 alpha/beta hydrolase [Spirochaetota bacterium]HPG49945.1 alpha/beta hydrolase [Spirochaetota bacterium]HPN11033.1 alpha/beta hydrolase [Spirochaetota bacterium]
MIKRYFSFTVVFFCFAIVSCGNQKVPFFRVLERGMAGLEEKAVQVGDHRIAYLEGGAGPDVLLLHGFGADKDNWVRFAKRLVKNYRVIAPDLPGFGDSSKLRGASYDMPAQVRRMHGFFRAIGLKQFHIAGNSMGGLIAGLYAAEYPGEVLSLGLLDPGGVANREESVIAREWKAGRNPLVVGSREDYDRMLEFMFVDPPLIPFWVKSWLADEAVRSKEFNDYIFSQVKPGDQLERMMGKISAKTLVLWGDRDTIFPASSAAVLGAGIKNSNVVIMKDCGHVPMLERPGEAAEHYLKLIK